MEESRLSELDRQTLLVVPTAGLAAHLHETYANQQLSLGREVWEAPNIFSWPECLHKFWKLNQHRLPSRALLSAQQSKLLWTQTIETSRYQNIELTLLNVQQTVAACSRSDRLIHDWLVPKEKLRDIHISDVSQFLEWQKGYENRLEQANAMDPVRLQSHLLELAGRGQLELGFERLVWYGYDLQTAAQLALSRVLQKCGVAISHAAPSVSSSQSFRIYHDADAEVRGALEQAKSLLAKEPSQAIQVVVPDLQNRYAQVQELARKVFYPQSSLLDTQRNDLVYRFSLGKKMHEWPAIESAMTLLELLKGRVAVVDFQYLLKSKFFAAPNSTSNAVKGFSSWLSKARIRYLKLEDLPDLVTSFCEKSETDFESIQALFLILNETLKLQHSVDGFTTVNEGESVKPRFSYGHWVQKFDALLSLWGWQTYPLGSEFNTVEHQLRQRWNSLLEEFSKFSIVQRSVGLSNGIARFQQLIRESVFLPKSAHSPLVISGVLEALGKQADHCFLTGMTQDYPAPAKGDPFVPSHVLTGTDYPDASARASAKQARKVMQSLFNAARNTEVSYALRTGALQESDNQSSPLFTRQFSTIKPSSVRVQSETPPLVALHTYEDVTGAQWDSNRRVRGGSAVFKDQSRCPFKAYATHRLGFEVFQETEFGLDHLDRGTLLHKMLELVWRAIPDQAALQSMGAEVQDRLLDECFQRLLDYSKSVLTDDKHRLFALERERVVDLSAEWLEIERKRPAHFSVVEQEQSYRGEWGGIEFNFTLDRVDLTDDGRSLIVDYKTGIVNRNDWLGERPREPQLPLYTLARDAQKASSAAGIAFAEVRRGGMKFTELAELDIFRKPTKHAQKNQEDWQEWRARWPDIFSRLASEFLAGHAAVDPIDKKVCDYCDLAPVCRIQELQERSSSTSASKAIAESPSGEFGP